MIKAEPELALKSQSVVRIQLVISALLSIVLLLYLGAWAALSVAYGGLISIAAAFLLRRGVAKASELAKDDPSKSMMILY
ncbi:MAG: ATP synthase subunit I, partial [Thiohalomonadales bacterium]